MNAFWAIKISPCSASHFCYWRIAECILQSWMCFYFSFLFARKIKITYTPSFKWRNMAYAWCRCSCCYILQHTGCHFRTKHRQTERMVDTTTTLRFSLKGPRISIKYAITCCRSRRSSFPIPLPRPMLAGLSLWIHTQPAAAAPTSPTQHSSPLPSLVPCTLRKAHALLHPLKSCH